jgi:hypothetical protein
MAAGAQQQQTFVLLLKAQDEATAAIQSVGHELQKLGEGVSLAGLSAQLGQLGERLDAVAPRASEAARAVENVGHAAEHAGGPLARFAEFGKQMVLWNVGYAAVNAVTGAVGNFAAGLVSVNETLEQNKATFAAIYGSQGAGSDAVRWLDRFAETVPATREQVIEAGLAVATLGDNLGDVMQPLSNIAAVMGVDLPRAAQAFSDAQMGRFEMLQMTLHVTKEELQKYGLQLDNTGHVLNNSFVPAFEKLGNERFGTAAALQMHTFGGLVSNVADALTRLQEIAGKGIFDVLKGQLEGVIKALSSTQAQRWAMAIGDAMGHALQGAITFAGWIIHNFGPPILAVLNVVTYAWNKMAPVVQGAVHLIEGTLAGIGTFLQGTVLPVVENALGQVKGWWDEHSTSVATVWSNIGAAVKRFWDWLGGAARNAMTELQGAWTIAWGVISGVVGVAVDLISGDWTKAKTDLLDIWKAIQVGVLEIINGLVDQIIHVFNLMAGPVATALNAVFVPAFKGIVALAVELFTALSLKVQDIFGGMVDSVADKVLSIPNKIAHVSNKLAEQIRRTLGFHTGAGGGGASGFGSGPTRDEQIWAQAQAAGQSAASFVGGMLGPSPIPTLTFDEHRVSSVVDKWFTALEKKIDPKLTTGATAAGKQWWNDFLLDLKKHGITLPALPGAGAAPPPPKGTGDTTGGDQGATSTKDLVQAAKNAFDLLLEKGPVTWAAGMKDIAAIAAAEHAAKVPEGQIALDVLRDTKQLIDRLLAQAQKQFDFDAHVAHPSIKALHQDEANYLAILAKTPGITPLDIASARQGMDRQIADLFKATAGGQMPAVPAPAYGTYGGLATGYGQTTVSFGGTQQSGWAAIVAELRAQLAFWRQRAIRDELLLRAGQETAESSTQTAMNTARLESVLSHWTTPGPPSPSVAGRTRASGAFAPVHRA